jgi:Subtilase family
MNRWNHPGQAAPDPVVPRTRQQAPEPPAPPSGAGTTACSLTHSNEPYLAWAALSQWRGFSRVGQWPASANNEPKVRILLRAPTMARLAQLHQSGLVTIPAVYLQPVPQPEPPFHPKKPPKHCFATATLDRAALSALIAHWPDICFELAAPLLDQDASPGGDGKAFFGAESALRLPPTRSALAIQAGEPVERRSVSGGAIGVFDYGCPFLRREYAAGAGGKTRVAALWHQETFELEGPWQLPAKMAYGREMSGATIHKLRKTARTDYYIDEEEAGVYAGLNYLVDYDSPRRRVYTATHGAHVLDVAGGCPDPVSHRDDDWASEAKLVFVQMPEDTAGDSSGASLGAYLLDALRYMLWVTDPTEPLVVNVSYGGTAGPHDGTSLIEQAMDDLLMQRPYNFAIVLAAGNSAHQGLHTRREASERRSALFRIAVASCDRTDTFVEFWYEMPTDAQLQFRTRVPDGDWSPWVVPDDQTVLKDLAGQGETVAAFISRKRVPNGTKSMALLALRPTEAPSDDDGPLAQAGQWEVEARLVPLKAGSSNPNPKPVSIDAWVRRDDSRPFKGSVQSSFLGITPEDAEETLSSIACGDHTIVVGGFRWSDGLPAGYCSVGKRRKGQWPLVYGLCEWDSVTPGILACAVRSGETQLMNGTSVAAPVVARIVYNLMKGSLENARRPLDKKSLQDALRQRAREPGSMVRIDPEPQ